MAAPYSIPVRSTPRPFMDNATLEARYPRVLRAMCWIACLSHWEALACLRDYREGFSFSGEAVNHYGGTVAVIRRAAIFWTRHAAASVYRDTRHHGG